VRETSRIASSSSRARDPARLDAWLHAVVATPGLTALTISDAASVLLEDSLRAVPLLEGRADPIVDVGSGNGAPGIPLAAMLPGCEVVLLDAERRKCDFLERWAPANARVVWGRAEDQETDWAGAAVAKALAPPPVAAEWCLPLVRPGGIVVLWVGGTADADRVARVAARLAAEPAPSPEGLLVLRKLGPTPAGFPRRAGIARKRPLA
jgi:16S rRNA (guanine527-N7)-methyltransferase